MKVVFELLPHQKALFYSTEPIAGIYGGRGCGKTRVLSVMIAVNLIQGKKALIMAQNYRSLSLNIFHEIRARLDEMYIPYKFNKSASIISYGKGMIIGATYEAVDAVRGMTEVEYLYLDEVALAPADLLATVVPVLRGNFKPKIRFASTPRKGSFWDKWILQGIKDNSIKVLTAAMTDNDKLPEEVKDLAFSSIVDEKLKQQELMGQILDGDDDTCIIYPSDLANAEYSLAEDDNYYIGIDASGTGQDLFSIAIRNGHKIVSLTGYDRLSGQQCLTELNRLLGMYGIRKNQIKTINLDMAYSEGLYEALLPEYEMTQTIAFASKAPDVKYANMRAYGYMQLAKYIKDGMYIPFYDVREELLNTHWLLDNYDRVLIQPKEEIKLIIKRSPDKSDALMLTMLENDKIGTNYQSIDKKQEQRYIKALFR